MDSYMRAGAFGAIGLFILSFFEIPVGILLELNHSGDLTMGDAIGFVVSLGLFIEILLLVCGVLMYLGFARIGEKTGDKALKAISIVMVLQVFAYSVINCLEVLSYASSLISVDVLSKLVYVEGALMMIFGAGLLKTRRDYKGFSILAGGGAIITGFLEMTVVLYLVSVIVYLPLLLVYTAFLHTASKRH